MSHSYDELLIEQRNHKSVIDASKGLYHAWYCTWQLGCNCNCPMKLVDLAKKIVKRIDGVMVVNTSDPVFIELRKLVKEYEKV